MTISLGGLLEDEPGGDGFALVPRMEGEALGGGRLVRGLVEAKMARCDFKRCECHVYDNKWARNASRLNRCRRDLTWPSPAAISSAQRTRSGDAIAEPPIVRRQESLVRLAEMSELKEVREEIVFGDVVHPQVAIPVQHFESALIHL